MSWGVSVSGIPSDNLEDYLQEVFDSQYPEPADEVKDQFESALKAIDGLKNEMGQSDHWAASASGHARQSDDDTVLDRIAVAVEKNIPQ